ncbi:hypothetical protein LR48_Vigan05g049100 [Vigna angularis]|uniref:Uncharacterized protein n=1 Tax=Phaseolus angularis TaxID=3914 RepID=A0A0L9UJY7_PHAAN|nr:uncharacterized protein HKW66_Vig0209260 [Vigna angularis]KOM42887.1 hypothetical protein LR48_Vigan05g049100 [Vigna angularis]
MAYFSREVLFLPPQAKRAFFFLLHEFLLPPQHKQVLFLLLRHDFFLTERPNFGVAPGVSHKPKRVFSFTSPKRVFSFTSKAQGRKGSSLGTLMVLGWFLLNPKTLPFASHKTLFAFLWVAALASLFVWQRNMISDFLVLGGVPVQQQPKLHSIMLCPFFFEEEFSVFKNNHDPYSLSF